MTTRIHDPVSGTTPADLDGSLPPPAGEPNTAVGFIGGSLALYRFHADWSDPLNSFVEPAMLQAAPFAEACFETRSGACIPQAGARAPALHPPPGPMMFPAADRHPRRPGGANPTTPARANPPPPPPTRPSPPPPAPPPPPESPR